MENKENTGEKIQAMGRVVQALGVIGSIIISILCFVASEDAYGTEEDFLIGFGIGYLIVGIISSIIAGIFIVGFGELVENSQKTANNTATIKYNSDSTKKLIEELRITLIAMNNNTQILNNHTSPVDTSSETFVTAPTESTISQQTSEPPTIPSTKTEISDLITTDQNIKLSEAYVLNEQQKSAAINAMVKNLEENRANTVKPDNNTTKMWKCPNCNNFNFANSNECMNCHTKVKFS